MGIQSYCQIMIRVPNPLRNATYLDSRSITILRREILRLLDGSLGKGEVPSSGTYSWIDFIDGKKIQEGQSSWYLSR